VELDHFVIQAQYEQCGRPLSYELGLFFLTGQHHSQREDLLSPSLPKETYRMVILPSAVQLCAQLFLPADLL
jgi:hypothetical protein